MTKTYRKDGNSKTKSRTYCKEHFIEKYGREPNISDTVSLFSCSSINHCERRDVSNRICNGILQITAKYRQDNESIENWTCQNCGTTINRR